MSLALAVLVFFLLTLMLGLAPALPAIREWQSPTDALPLRVFPNSAVDVRRLAAGFRAYVRETFRESLAEVRGNGRGNEGTSSDGTPYVIVPDAVADVLNPAERRAGSAARLVLSAGDVRLPGDTLYKTEIYAADSIVGGGKNTYRALLAEGSIGLGAQSTVLRWCHAGSNMTVDPGCRLYGRLSAEGSVRLYPECGFERLHAFRIEFGEPISVRKRQPSRGEPLQPEELPEVEEASGLRWWIRRPLELEAGVLVGANLVVTSSARIGRDSLVRGSVKSHDELHLEPGVTIEGSVVSGADIHIGRGCVISGPILAEGDIHIAGGCKIGSRLRATTVSGRNIRIRPGTVVHGTVWAHGEGRLVSDA